MRAGLSGIHDIPALPIPKEASYFSTRAAPVLSSRPTLRDNSREMVPPARKKTAQRKRDRDSAELIERARQMKADAQLAYAEALNAIEMALGQRERLAIQQLELAQQKNRQKQK